MGQEHDASLKHRQGAGRQGVFGCGGFDEPEGFRDLSWGRSASHAKEGPGYGDGPPEFPQGRVMEFIEQKGCELT